MPEMIIRKEMIRIFGNILILPWIWKLEKLKLIIDPSENIRSMKINLKLYHLQKESIEFINKINLLLIILVNLLRLGSCWKNFEIFSSPFNNIFYPYSYQFVCSMLFIQNLNVTSILRKRQNFSFFFFLILIHNVFKKKLKVNDIIYRFIISEKKKKSENQFIFLFNVAKIST
jgi:hypothetical protein